MGGGEKNGTIFGGWNKKFTLGNLRHNWELTPLVSLPILVVSGAIYMLYRTSTTSGDIRWANKGDQFSDPHNTIKPNQETKLHTVNPKKYKPIPDLEAIKDDLKDSAPNQ